MVEHPTTLLAAAMRAGRRKMALTAMANAASPRRRVAASGRREGRRERGHLSRSPPLAAAPRCTPLLAAARRPPRTAPPPPHVTTPRPSRGPLAHLSSSTRDVISLAASERPLVIDEQTNGPLRVDSFSLDRQGFSTRLTPLFRQFSVCWGEKKRRDSVKYRRCIRFARQNVRPRTVPL